MKSQDTKSSSELKREVHQELNKVSKSIDELQGRLTPGQILDDAIFYPNGRNLNKTFQHLKQNPIGTTFLSLGTLLLMEDGTHSSYESVVKTKVNAGVSSAKEGISSVKNQMKNKLPQGEPGDIKNKVVGIADSFQSKVNDIRSGIAAKIPDREALNRGREKIHNLDNTTFMAIGAGLGALTGVSLPISEAEDKLMREKFDGRLNDFNRELRDAMNECSNILKDLVVQDVKDHSLKFF